MQPIELVYTLISLIFIIIVVYRAENKLLLGIIIFWLLADPILGNPKYVLRIEAANFNLNINRIVLVPLLMILPIAWIKRNNLRNLIGKKGANNNQPISFEKWMLLFAITSVVSGLYNFEQIELRNLLILISNILVFLLFYYECKWSISRKDIILLLYSILILAVMSAIVGVLQFFFDPELFRVGSARLAFANFYRANGLLRAEYTQGFFQITALFIIFYINRHGLFRFIFFIFSSIAIFLTMHRLSWVAWFITLLIFGFFKLKEGKIKPEQIFLGLIPLIIVIFIGIKIYIDSGLFEAIGDRFYADTLSGRVEYYNLGFDIIKNNPLGIGDYNSNYYRQLAYSAGVPFGREEDITASLRPFVIHNGILSAGVKFGLLGMFFFSLFIFGTIILYLKKAHKEFTKYFLPFFLSLLYFVYNTTNDFSDFGAQVSILLSILLGCFASYAFCGFNYRKNQQ